MRTEIITDKHHFEVLRNDGAVLAWFRGVRSVVSVNDTGQELHVEDWSQQPWEELHLSSLLDYLTNQVYGLQSDLTLKNMALDDGLVGITSPLCGIIHQGGLGSL